MYHLHTFIEIEASPEAVRQKFLEFSQLSTYHKDGFLKSIGPKVAGEPFEPGTTLHVELRDMTIEPIMTQNTPEQFSWQGVGLFGTFVVEHKFRFEPSILTPGGTKFIHEEDFTGALSFLMSDGFVARSLGLKEKTNKGFQEFNRDLRTWCEGS